MNKSRKLGWSGFVDSHKVMCMVMDEFVGLKMIPKLPEGKNARERVNGTELLALFDFF